METKHSVVKVIISKLKWFGLALLVFMLEQAPTFLITKEQPMWQTLLLVVIFLLISGGTYYLAVKLHIVGDQAIPKNDYRALWIGLGVVAVFVVKMIGGILLFLEHGGSQYGQSSCLRKGRLISDSYGYASCYCGTNCGRNCFSRAALWEALWCRVLSGLDF